MKCPKCGYTRKMGESAPDWQCPSCGVAYAKAGTADHRAARVHREPAGGSGGKILAMLVVLALLGGAAAWWKGSRPQVGPAAESGIAHASVIMYSLTTCGFCTQKRAQLTAAGIPFVEYFLDQDRARFDELIEKLQAAGHKGGAIGTPSFDVNGTILLNNPSLDTIRRHL